MKIKICGITNEVDYEAVVGFGADYVGFIFYSGSPRYVEPDCVARMIRRGTVGRHRKVGVFVNEDIPTVREIYHLAGLDIVQLHGDESPGYVKQLGLPCWKAIRVIDRESLKSIEQYQCETILLDTYKKEQYGGTGSAFDFRLAREALRTRKQIILAGGISAENIQSVFELACPLFGVDVNSSLEIAPGRKSPAKMKQFFHIFSGLNTGLKGVNHVT